MKDTLPIIIGTRFPILLVSTPRNNAKSAPDPTAMLAAYPTYEFVALAGCSWSVIIALFAFGGVGGSRGARVGGVGTGAGSGG